MRPAGRTLAAAQHLVHFMTLFLVLTLSSLPLLTYTTSDKCDVAHTSVWAASQAGNPDAKCALMMWDLFFASLFVGGTVRGLRRAAHAQVIDDRSIYARSVLEARS